VWLNVQLNGNPAEINMKDMRDLGDVQKDIKDLFGGQIPVPPARIYLEFPDDDDQRPKDDVIKLFEDLDELPIEYFLSRGKDTNAKFLTII
jgi:hypothetical protein